MDRDVKENKKLSPIYAPIVFLDELDEKDKLFYLKEQKPLKERLKEVIDYLEK